MGKTGYLAIALFSGMATNAAGADVCKAIALRDVAAVEAPDTVLQRGSYDEAVTQYVVEENTGLTKFCSHGGYCYPTHVRINGQKVEALRLINCRVTTRNQQIGGETIYYLDVRREENSPAVLRLDDLDNKFLELGLCSACAGNVAMLYAKKPKSRCAQLARQALEGNPVAASALREFPDYCTWK